MSAANPLNVYSGPNAVQQYFDPDIHPPLPLVEIPICLNPFYSDGVRIYAKLMSMHPANNVKIMPAMNMLANEVQAGKTKTVVEYSSGSTVISLALASRIHHGIHDVRAFLSNKTSASKLKLMQFFGLDVTLFGGPSQPEPLDERGGIQRARLLAQSDERFLNANQYENNGNWQSHVKWTGPQILRQLPNINLICAGMGTSGTMTGIGQFFKKAKPSVTRLGVCTAAGDRVPGPRSLALLQPVIDFPWRDSINAIEEVGSKEAFSLSLELCREGLICGPSSGFNLQGLLNYLEKRKVAGTLHGLASDDGLINCVFICCDLPYQYIDEYFDKCEADAFHPIHNKNLTAVDLYRYDEAWELTPEQALSQFSTTTPSSQPLVIDLRRPQDFTSSHIPGAIHVPLQSLDATTKSPFFETTIMESQWRELDAAFSVERIRSDKLEGKNVLLTCYDGDTARVATSILRAREVVASSVKGGYTSLTGKLPALVVEERGRLAEKSGAKGTEVEVKELRADSLSPRSQSPVEDWSQAA